MKNNTTKRKKIIVIAITTLLAAGILSVGAMALTHTGFFTRPNQESTNSDNHENLNKNTAPSSDSSSANSNESTPGKTPEENEPTGPTPSEEIAASITAANQNGSVLQIRTLIQTVTSDGKCTLTISKDNQTYTYSANIQPQASASTCKGFDVPLSSLSSGNWSITIDITTGGSSIHLTKTVTIS